MMPGPFTTEVAQTLTLKNPNSVPVAFKVRYSRNLVQRQC